MTPPGSPMHVSVCHVVVVVLLTEHDDILRRGDLYLARVVSLAYLDIVIIDHIVVVVVLSAFGDDAAP